MGDEVETVSWEVIQTVESYLNQNLVMGSFLEISFEATLRSKMNVLSVWKRHFSVFCKLLSDEVETVFSENEAKHSNILKPKVSHTKLLSKWFWSYLELKNECSERLKRAFFSFLQNFEWQIWSHFLGKWGKEFKAI